MFLHCLPLWTLWVLCLSPPRHDSLGCLRPSPSCMQWRHSTLMQLTVFLRCWYFRWSPISKSNNGAPPGAWISFRTAPARVSLDIITTKRQTATGVWALSLWRRDYGKMPVFDFYAKLSPSKQRYQTSLVRAVCYMPSSSSSSCSSSSSWSI